MIAKKGYDRTWYIVNCKEEQLRDKLKQIAERGGKILGWDQCTDLQAIIHKENEVDIWIEVVYDTMQEQMVQLCLECGIDLD